MLAGIVQAATRTTPRSFGSTITSHLRFSSSSSSTNKDKSPSPSQVYLNPERKRKLISIYHQAGSFVTPENLSTYIDDQFSRTIRNPDRREENKKYLKFQLEERRSSKKLTMVSAADGSSPRFGDTSAAMRNHTRERRMRAALFGVDDSLQAGLETVEEERRNVPDALKE